MQSKLTFKKSYELVKSLWNNKKQKVKELHKITKFPVRILYRWTFQLKKTKDLKQHRHSRRPKRLSSKKLHHLGQLAHSRVGATSFEITDSFNNTYPELNIAPRTVRENL